MADRGTRDGIRVNAINPGFLETQRLESRLDYLSARDRIGKDQARQRMLENLRVRRFGRAEEVADMVAYLASNRSDYLQGAIIDIDGGLNRAV